MERQAKRKAAVEQYRREKELVAERQAAVARVLAAKKTSTQDQDYAKQRAEQEIAAAAARRRDAEEASSREGLRSERLLMEAARQSKLNQLGLKPTEARAVVDRLHNKATEAAQVSCSLLGWCHRGD